MKTSEERGRLMLCSDTIYNTIFNTIYTKLTSWAFFSFIFMVILIFLKKPKNIYIFYSPLLLLKKIKFVYSYPNIPQGIEIIMTFADMCLSRSVISYRTVKYQLSLLSSKIQTIPSDQVMAF